MLMAWHIAIDSWRFGNRMPPSSNMPADPPRIAREKRTIRAMVSIYCRGHHAPADELCSQCRELLDYSYNRLDRCPFGISKPTCGNCTVHCYKPSMRERVKQAMRYSGPRLLLRHPILSLRHWLDGFRRVARP